MIGVFKIFHLQTKQLFFEAPVMRFTDDTAMTLTIAKSLVEKRTVDPIDIAKGFVQDYYQEPNRGYGAGVVTVSICRINNISPPCSMLEHRRYQHKILIDSIISVDYTK